MSVDRANDTLARLLEARGFVRRGEVFVRRQDPITQVVGLVKSRFATARGPAHVWVEVVLSFGPGPARGRRLGSFQQQPDVLASIRLNEIAPELPPYLDANAPAAELEALLVAHLLPFLDETSSVAGFDRALEKLGDTRTLARAILFARIGDERRSRALFAQAPGDAEAIRRLAASLGVELD